MENSVLMTLMLMLDIFFCFFMYVLFEIWFALCFECFDELFT